MTVLGYGAVIRVLLVKSVCRHIHDLYVRRLEEDLSFFQRGVPDDQHSSPVTRKDARIGCGPLLRHDNRGLHNHLNLLLQRRADEVRTRHHRVRGPRVDRRQGRLRLKASVPPARLVECVLS